MDMYVYLLSLGYLSAIDLGRITCTSKSLNVMISTNDRLYQDLYETYFNGINFNANDEEDTLYKTLFKRIYTTGCSSCNGKVSSTLNNQTTLPYQCVDCNKVICGDCKCSCRYCNICDVEFEDEKSNGRSVRISNVYCSYEIPCVIKCDICCMHVHTRCHLEEAKCFRYTQCPGCMTRVCQHCSMHIANDCNKCSGNFTTRTMGQERYFLSNGHYCDSCYISNESCCKYHARRDGNEESR